MTFNVNRDSLAPRPDWVYKKTEVITHLKNFAADNYQSERNDLRGTVSFISPYISRGLITLPEVTEIILENNNKNKVYKYINELAWREYWQRVWRQLNADIFSDIRNEQDFKSKDISQAIVEGKTGINTLDDSIQALYEIGYVHNHARMWLAGLTANIASTWWKTGADWMYYHLYDGDLASNHLSWQWVAGTFSHKQYLPQQGNINKYSDSDQTNTFLDASYQKIGEMDVPEVLQKRQALELELDLPKSDEIDIDADKPTLLYHAYWLNPDWQLISELADNPDQVNRILVFEPSHYQNHPISAKVFEFIIKLARKNLENVKVYVGEQADLVREQNLDSNKVHYLDHPITKNWIGQADSYQQTYLFPQVDEQFYSSFSKFWKQAKPYYDKL